MLNAMDELKKFILEECREDHVGLWYIVKNVHRDFPDSNDVKAKEITLRLLKDLLDKKLIVAGFPTKDGRSFDAWEYPTDEIISRISSEWDALGREPNIGEIIWFTSID